MILDFNLFLEKFKENSVSVSPLVMAFALVADFFLVVSDA